MSPLPHGQNFRLLIAGVNVRHSNQDIYRASSLTNLQLLPLQTASDRALVPHHDTQMMHLITSPSTGLFLFCTVLPAAASCQKNAIKPTLPHRFVLILPQSAHCAA